MLFNTEKLRGMPKKIKALVRREAEVSLVQQVLLFCCLVAFLYACSQQLVPASDSAPALSVLMTFHCMAE